MKRLALILLAICFGLNSNAQIQTKFWGLELSSFYYESLETLKNRITDKCQYAMVGDNEISAMNGKFGGYYWDYISFKFYKGEFSRGLHQVYFASNHADYSSARGKYNNLLETLVNKYGAPEQPQNSSKRNAANWFSTDRKYACSLSLVGSDNQGEEKPWTVYIMYADVNLLKLELNKEKEEF